jgi:hypothetical protein
MSFEYVAKKLGNNSKKIKITFKKTLIVNSGNACYHSVQNLSSFRLLSKNLNIKIFSPTYLPTYLLPVALNGCEACTVTLGEEHKLRVYDSRVLKRTF